MRFPVGLAGGPLDAGQAPGGLHSSLGGDVRKFRLLGALPENLDALLAFCLAILLGGHVNPARADKDLLQRNNCFACHGIDKRKYGPKLVDVAGRYSGDAGAAQVLARKIQAGGTGVWGEDIMPRQPMVSDADALALAHYILSLR